MPLASVVIPAYNEGMVIDRCLTALAGADLHIVVVANGCTDDTAARARAHEVDVVELGTGSKIAALNAGDERCAGLYPRIYLDADIELAADDARALAEYLDKESQPRVGAPQAEFDTSRSRAAVRLFYVAYRRMPYLTNAMVGAGCYALNSAGRARWSAFPDITADDLFVQGLFAEDERVVVDGTRFRIVAPRTVRGLLKIRTRSYQGKSEVAAQELSGSMAGSRSSSLRTAAELMRTDRRMIAPVAVYLLLNTVAALRARWGRSSGWLTDSSSRS